MAFVPKQLSNRFLALLGTMSLVTALTHSPLARACDPDAIQIVTMAPVRVSVPVGGTATVSTIVGCNANSDDWTADSTLGTGGTMDFDIHLVDEDGGLNPDDTLATHNFRRTVRRAIRSFAFPLRIRSRMQIQCPAADEEITGTPDKSGEGEPGCDDPADLALEINNGSTSESDNHYAGNLFGNPGAKKTVPACCVELTEDAADSTAQTRTALLLGGEKLGHVCVTSAALSTEANASGPTRRDQLVPCDAGIDYFDGPYIVLL